MTSQTTGVNNTYYKMIFSHQLNIQI